MSTWFDEIMFRKSLLGKLSPRMQMSLEDRGTWIGRITLWLTRSSGLANQQFGSENRKTINFLTPWIQNFIEKVWLGGMTNLPFMIVDQWVFRSSFFDDCCLTGSGESELTQSVKMAKRNKNPRQISVKI